MLVILDTGCYLIVVWRRSGGRRGSNKVLEELKPNMKTRQDEDFRPRHLSSFYVFDKLKYFSQ